MDPIWITLLVVAAIIVVIAVAIGVRRHRSDDYGSTLGPHDQPDHSQDARMAEARQRSDRTGFGAGGSV